MKAFVSGVRFGFYLGGAVIGASIVLYSAAALLSVAKDFMKKEKDDEKKE